MNNVSFLRIRPCNSDNDLYLNSRKKEQTSSFLINNTDYDLNKIHIKGFQTISDSEKIDSFAWIVNKNNLDQFSDIDRRLLIYKMSSNKQTDYEVISRHKIPYVFTVDLSYINLIKSSSFSNLMTNISSYADTIEQALILIKAGVNDLWLRDWNNNDIEILAKKNNLNLYERTVTSKVLNINQARNILSKDKFTSFLKSRDVRGYKRQDVEWHPGKDTTIPAKDTISYSFPRTSYSEEIHDIISSIESGVELSDSNLSKLFYANGSQIDDIASVADNMRKNVNGDNVSFVINRNINYTNQCYYKCGFCGFSKGPQSLSLKEKPYLLSIEEVVERSVEAVNNGATEVCLQGGIHPEYTGAFYLDLVKEIRKNLPNIHIHGFTPLEIWQGAETINLDLVDYLKLLKDAGLDTLPGTAAEILDDRIRRYLCPDKITSSQWALVMEQAHSIGIKSTATIMFGHIDDVSSWVNHFSLLRDIQKNTKGFTEIVPLPFVHMGAPMFIAGKSMPGPTWDEVVLIHALARIYFHGQINNIQASWVKLGLSGVEKLLKAGVNDLGGTLMNENISRAAGAVHGQELDRDSLIGFISDTGRVPIIRDTLYRTRETFSEVKSH